MRVVGVDFNPEHDVKDRLRCLFTLLLDYPARERQSMTATHCLTDGRTVEFERSGEERAAKAHHALSGRSRLQPRQSATFTKTPSCPERSRACGIGEPLCEVRPLPHGCHWREAVPLLAQPVLRVGPCDQFSVVDPGSSAEAPLPLAGSADKASSGAKRGGAA